MTKHCRHILVVACSALLGVAALEAELERVVVRPREIQDVFEDALHGRAERYAQWNDLVEAPARAS